MYLKAIEAQGFKSFADKIIIDLNNNITGVVGPNGSGKSNVVDAIRWVLGEQSIKSLRGEGNMTDVIFSGSKTRNASNTATVTLLFDNKDKYLNLEFDEIAIKRRLYKDGTNEYYINNEKVRLKDITNLLLDSGMAKESFNIISQGKIEEILSSKPEDRRVVFEEAANVLKYKKRKEESLRKLDKTNQNMVRINDVIKELEDRIEPLKEQSQKAIKFKEYKEELKNVEISLISSDITNLNFDFQKNKQLIDSLQKEIEMINTSNRLGEARILEFKKSIDELDLEYKEKQSLLLETSTNLEKLNSRKTIINERIAYQKSDKVYEQTIRLKEENLKLNAVINDLKLKKQTLQSNIYDVINKIKVEQVEFTKTKELKFNYSNDLNILLKEESSLNYKIEALKTSIDNNSSIPSSVKKVLDNPKLRGIHNTVSNLFDVSEKYSKAIAIALGASVNNVVVDDEICAKEAINYLKVSNLGRVTFLPLNIIKPRNIEGNYKIASSVIKYDKKYENIILNLLGNVIVVNNIDEANNLAKQINYRFRIVTEDGDIINVGGALTGGKVNTTNVILERYKLEKYINELENINSQIGLKEETGNQIDNNLKTIEDKIYLLNKEKLEFEVMYNGVVNNLNTSIEQYKVNELELSSSNNILNDKINEEQENILNEYYKTLDYKNILTTTLEEINKKRNSLKSDLSDFEFSCKRENTLFNEKNESLKQSEILVNRLDVKLDNLLNVLNEAYSITYEEAIKKYKLEIPVNNARNLVSNLKRKIVEMGTINLNSIEEYKEVNERLSFLTNQKEDLVKAENILLNIIDQMDKIMEKEFIETFEVIRNNFKNTFSELFKGGYADLKLTDKDNILETGVEIVASPPGKSLKTISLLSGGEKTFTAISLLFAILKSKPVPFCIFDEVEAALDDVNVDSFGSYVRSLKEKTQFILITHKKKTMEYVDTLYGITMQESGVSKLVSVKLEEVNA